MENVEVGRYEVLSITASMEGVEIQSIQVQIPLVRVMQTNSRVPFVL